MASASTSEKISTTASRGGVSIATGNTVGPPAIGTTGSLLPHLTPSTATLAASESIDAALPNNPSAGGLDEQQTVQAEQDENTAALANATQTGQAMQAQLQSQLNTNEQTATAAGITASVNQQAQKPFDEILIWLGLIGAAIGLWAIWKR